MSSDAVVFLIFTKIYENIAQDQVHRESIALSMTLPICLVSKCRDASTGEEIIQFSAHSPALLQPGYQEHDHDHIGRGGLQKAFQGLVESLSTSAADPD